MPQIEGPDGEIKYIPRVYFATKVASSSPGPVPLFHVPLILAHAWKGHPYNVDSLLETNEPKLGIAKYLQTDGAVGDYFGYGSDMHVAFKNAKRHGLGGAWCVSMSALTRASVVADATATKQVKVYSVRFGPPGGWTKLKFATGILTATVLKNFAFLSANFTSGGTRLLLKGDTSWIQEGKTYSLGSNTIAVASVTVLRKGVEIDANGQDQPFVELTATFGSSLTTAGYALIGEYDTVNTFATSGTITTSQEFLDFINRDLFPKGIVGAIKDAAFTGVIPDTVATATPIKELSTPWQTATAGTCPAATSTDVTALITLLNASAWDDFMLRYGLIPQAFYLVMGDSVSHGLLRDFAAAQRADGFPISVTTGPTWGDHVIDAGNDTDPKFRCAALNSQDVALCGPGADRLAPYLSMAAAVFGRRVKGGPGHNLTNDDLAFTTYEVRWDEKNSGQLSALCRAGFITIKLSTGRKPRYRISQGLTTLQANSGQIWNISSTDTWSVMQRDLADFVDRVQLVDLEEDLVGADGVTPATIASALGIRAEKYLLKNGYLLSYRLSSVTLNAEANGFDIQQEYTNARTNDFMSVLSTILVD